MTGLLTPTEVQVLAPLLCLFAGGILSALPLGRVVPRVVAILSTASALVFALYQYTPATNKSEALAERFGPALREIVQFRMESVAGTLLIVGFAFLTAVLLASRPLADARRESLSATGFLFAAAAGVVLVMARSLFLAFVGLEVLGLALLLHGLAWSNGAERRGASSLLWRQLILALLMLEGIALVYGGEGTLTVLGIEAVNRPGMRVPAGLAVVGGTLVFAALFSRFGVFPISLAARREFTDSPPETRLVRAGVGISAICLLLFASARLIPRYSLWILPALTVGTLLVGWFGVWFAPRKASRDASLAMAQTGTLFSAFAGLCLGAGVQDAGYAIRAGLLALVPMALAWLLWIGSQACVENREGRDSSVDSLRGLGRSRPFVAAMLTLSALSFAGLPPTGAFWSRWLLLQSTWISIGPGTACIFAFCFLLGVVWCVRFVGSLWLDEAAPGSGAGSGAPAESTVPFATLAVLAVIGALALTLGLIPQLLLETLVHIRL